jgi:hypothetical protein
MGAMTWIGLGVTAFGLLVLGRNYLPESLREGIDSVMSIQQSEADEEYAKQTGEDDETSESN